MSIRILIVDDHGVLRAGLRARLNAEPDFQVVGEAEDGPTALRLAEELHPDVVLLDIGLPRMDGIEVTKRFQVKMPDIRVLILTLHEDETLLRRAIENGASGYIVKRAVEAELISAIRAVYGGQMYVHPTMTRALLRGLTPANQPNKEPAQTLSPRETEVLKLVAQGYTSREIGEMLHLSVRTVEGHRANLASKLGLSSPIQILRYALDHGLVE